ncbi:MAG: sterol desaturase family protein, partial [Boseongicola sp.]
VHNMYVHMDLDFGHGPAKYLIASPNFHRWHHADVEEAHGKNLANIMPIYDVLFGTYYYPGRCDAPLGALKSGIEDKNALLIYIYPFQEWIRLAKAEFSKLERAWEARKAKSHARALERQKQI